MHRFSVFDDEITPISLDRRRALVVVIASILVTKDGYAVVNGSTVAGHSRLDTVSISDVSAAVVVVVVVQKTVCTSYPIVYLIQDSKAVKPRVSVGWSVVCSVCSSTIAVVVVVDI